jgi:hypothetical protein
MTRLIFNQKHLAKWVRELKGPLDIAVAFWGAGAIEELGLDDSSREIRILLDLSAGATNPDVVRDLIKHYPDGVRSVRRLHSKAFLGKSEIAVGSANASANGLGLEGAEVSQWYELGMISSDTTAIRDAHDWFAELWSGAHPVDVEGTIFAEVQKAWKERQKHRPHPDTGTDSLIAAAIKNPEAFKRKGWYVVVDLYDMSKDGLKRIAKKSENLGRPAYGWEDWEEIPSQAHLISLTKTEDLFQFGNAKGAPDAVYFSAEHNNGPVQFVTASHIPGYKRNIGKIDEWRSSLSKAEDEYPGWKAEGGMCMDLGEFAERYGIAN